MLKNAVVIEGLRPATSSSRARSSTLRYEGDDDAVDLPRRLDRGAARDYDVLSTESPLGQAILGAGPGTTVTYKGPKTRIDGDRRRRAPARTSTTTRPDASAAGTPSEHRFGTPSSWHNRTFSSLSCRNFRLFFFGQLISNSGNWLTIVGLTLLVLHLTKSGLAVGLLSACQFGPILVLSPWAA